MTHSLPTPLPYLEATAWFLVDLQVAGRAAWTRIKHRQELNRYGRYLAEHAIVWQAATAADVQAYVRTRAQLSASARAATIGTLRVFYGWAVRQGFVTTSPAAALLTPTRARPQPEVLQARQIREIVTYLAHQTGVRARRDEALVLTALYAGLRAAELAALRWTDLDLDAQTITIRLSKMRHGRMVPLHRELAACLQRWQEIQRTAMPSAYVFANVETGAPIRPARVGKVMRRIARATGVQVRAHLLRHTFATWMLRRSKDLYAVARALGHTDVRWTEAFYINAATCVEQVAEAVAQLPPLGEW